MNIHKYMTCKQEVKWSRETKETNWREREIKKGEGRKVQEKYAQCAICTQRKKSSCKTVLCTMNIHDKN